MPPLTVPKTSNQSELCGMHHTEGIVWVNKKRSYPVLLLASCCFFTHPTLFGDKEGRVPNIFQKKKNVSSFEGSIQCGNHRNVWVTHSRVYYNPPFPPQVD